MVNENMSGEAELAFAREIAAVVGMDTHTKEASAKESPEAGIVKTASDMDMGDLLEDENFRRGVFDEINDQRHVWEPIVKERLFGVQE